MPQLFCSIKTKAIIFMRYLFLETIKHIEKHAFFLHTLLGKIYLKSYRNIVTREIDIAEVTCKSKVLHIGGGIPYTAMMIASLTGAEVTVLENDAKIMHTACKWLNKYCCGYKINIILADGAKFSSAPFDVVIISLNISSKRYVLLNALNTSLPGTRIIYRKAQKVFSAIYGDIEPLGGSESYFKKKAQHHGPILEASYLLTKDTG